MSKSKLLALSMILIFISAAAGSSATYFLQARKHKAELLGNTASIDLLVVEDFLEQISILEKQDVESAKVKLNYYLAARVYDAKMNERATGDVGYYSKQILEISAEQRKRKEYQIQEEKITKEMAEFKLIPMKYL